MDAGPCSPREADPPYDVGMDASTPWLRSTVCTAASVPGRRPRTIVALAGCLLVHLGLVASAASAQTILNIERLQPDEVEGWHWGVEGDFSLAEGNSEYVDVLAGVVLGHRWSGDWLRVFTGIDYRSETGEGTQNDRYFHLRLNHWLAERWQSFHFVQLQASRSNLLQRRVLLGSGLRRRLLDGRTTLDVGTGAMYESEDLDGDRLEGSHPEESRVWRMANLIVATRRLSETVRLVGVGYVQPDVSDFGDARLLADVSILFSITENVDLTVRNEWRRDSRPPENVEESDYVISTGFTVSFR